MRQVLLVEDKPRYRQSLRFWLQNEPYQLIESATPEEGVEILKTHPDIRVVLLDLEFGERTSRGTVVLDHVKREGNRHLVIVLTGHEELLDAGMAQQYEVFNYIPKSRESQAIRFSLAQAFKELERKQLLKTNKYLLDVQQRISSNQTLPEILNFISEAVRAAVGAYNCHVRVYDFKKGDFRLEGFAGADESLRDLFALPRAKGHHFSGLVATSGRSKTFGNLQKMNEFREFAGRILNAPGVTESQRQYLNSVESAYIVPITTGLFRPGVDAVLNVSSAEINFFDDATKLTIDEFVIQTELAIMTNWLQMKRDEVTRDYGEITAMLSDISDRLRGPNPEPAIFAAVAERIAKIVNPEVVSIFLYNNKTAKIENKAELRGDEWLTEVDESYGSGQSLTGSVYADNTPIQIPVWGDSDTLKPTGDERFDSAHLDVYLQKIPSGRIEHYLGVPIEIGGKPRGVLRAVNKKSAYYQKETAASDSSSLLDRGFSNDCRNAMQIAAVHLGVAIRNAELFQQKERQIEQIRTMGEIGQLIASASDINEILKVTIQKVADVMQAEICMLFLKTEGGDRVVLKERIGIPEEVLPNAFYAMREGETGTVAATGEAKLLRHRQNGKYDAAILAQLRAVHDASTEIESVMIVAIRAGKDVLGVMKVMNKEGHIEYTEDDLEWFQTLAAYVGLALENTRDAIRKRNAALSSLVSAVAHEINNTSGLIPSNVAGIRAQLVAPNTKVVRRLALIERVAEQATEFANEIAGFGAGRRGEKLIVDINQYIREAIADLLEIPKYETSETFRVEMQLTLEPLLCKVFVNPFIQIVRNVVINANQALEHRHGGYVRISTGKSDGIHSGAAVLSFDDNGPGIKKEHLSRLFDPDFTTKPNGNGLGLWLVRTQLEQIGGLIQVYNRDPEEGASFVITIPLAVSGGRA